MVRQSLQGLVARRDVSADDVDLCSRSLGDCIDFHVGAPRASHRCLSTTDIPSTMGPAGACGLSGRLATLQCGPAREPPLALKPRSFESPDKWETAVFL